MGKKSTLAYMNMGLVREFIVHEQGRGLSPYSIQGKVRSLKAFSSWLHNEGYTSDNILFTLKVPKAPVNLIEPLTDWEIEKLVSYQNPLTAIGSRNIALFILLLDSGLGISELCGLRYEDAHIEEGYLKVFGKGSKERIVPIGALAQKILWRYVFHFRPEPLTPGDGCLCRHTYATNFMCHNCGDVFRLQQILGHTTLEMVRKYVHYASTQALMNGRIASPVDHMGIRNLRGYKIDRLLRNGHR